MQLVGEDGNVFAILGRMFKALRRGGVCAAEIEEFKKEATSDDYEHALATCDDWVTTL